jgi:hypothetical protein
LATFEEKDFILNEIFEGCYRTILEKVKNKTNAKIMVMEPFLIPVACNMDYRVDLSPKKIN